MTTNLKLQQNRVNQIFNPNAFFLFLLTNDKDITMLYTYYLQILHHLQAMQMTFLISYLHVQGSKIVGKMDQFGGNFKTKLNSAELIFSKSALF